MGIDQTVDRLAEGEAEDTELKGKPSYVPASLKAMKRGQRIEQEIGISALHEIARLTKKFGCEAKHSRAEHAMTKKRFEQIQLTPKEHIDVLFQLCQYTRPKIKPLEAEDAAEKVAAIEEGGAQITFEWGSPMIEEKIEQNKREAQAYRASIADSDES